MEYDVLSESYIIDADHYICIDQEERPINVRELLAEEEKGELYYRGEKDKYNIDDLLCRAYENLYYMAKSDLMEENSDPADFSRLFYHLTGHTLCEPGGFTYLNLRPIEKKQHYYQYSIKENERKFSIEELAKYGFLKCDDTDVSELCEKIGELKGTKTIDLSGAPIKALPVRIGELKRLLKLDLFNTQISSLPDTLSDLKGLLSLKLDSTPMSIIPDVVTQLTNLEVLSLQDTQIEKLPESIGNLTHLRILNLSGTRITELPESISGLENLHVIDLSNTPISVLPDWIETMTNLKILALDGTNIVGKSPRIAWLSDLHRKKTGIWMVTELPDRNDASRTIWHEISEEFENYLESLEEEEPD